MSMRQESLFLRPAPIRHHLTPDLRPRAHDALPGIRFGVLRSVVPEISPFIPVHFLSFQRMLGLSLQSR